jgi:beta-lactamase class A
MRRTVTRRAALGLGTAAGTGAATTAVLGAGATGWAEPVVAKVPPRDRIKKVHDVQAAKASGVWSSYVTAVGGTKPVISRNANTVVDAYSVNKVAVAVAVLDKIDRGKLSLADRVQLHANTVIPADDDGYLYLDVAYPSSLTLGHVMTAMLSQSDNTAVRLCARALAKALEPGGATAAQAVNQILAHKGFPKTRVEQIYGPDAQPVVDRFYLGWTTPKQTMTC